MVFKFGVVLKSVFDLFKKNKKGIFFVIALFSLVDIISVLSVHYTDNAMLVSAISSLKILFVPLLVCVLCREKKFEYKYKAVGRVLSPFRVVFMFFKDLFKLRIIIIFTLFFVVASITGKVLTSGIPQVMDNAIPAYMEISVEQKEGYDYPVFKAYEKNLSTMSDFNIYLTVPVVVAFAYFIVVSGMISFIKIYGGDKRTVFDSIGFSLRVAFRYIFPVSVMVISYIGLSYAIAHIFSLEFVSSLSDNTVIYLSMLGIVAGWILATILILFFYQISVEKVSRKI